MSKIIRCNDCKNAECKVTSYTNNYKYCNWYCKHGGTNRLTEMSVLDDKVIPVPSWCPMIESGEAKKPLTYSEKREMLEKLEPMTEWDDIKVNTVYHVPHILSTNRMDILITSKSNHCCYYKVLSEQGRTNYTEYHVLYKTTLFSKFLVPHKIKEFVVYNKK